MAAPVPAIPFVGTEADSEASIRAHSLLNERCSSLGADSGEAPSRLICVATIRCAATSARHSSQPATCASTHSRSAAWMRPLASQGSRAQASA
jgi:hypothetical protein